MGKLTMQKNVSLKNRTTFKIGGRARYFIETRNEKDLISAVSLAKRKNLPFLILAGGSNVLVSDKGFKGLVIKIGDAGRNIKDAKITAGAGTNLGKLSGLAVKESLTGFEWTAGIPGTLGGAIRGNAGAFGKSMSQNVQSVRVFDARSGKIKILKNKDCRFSYRNSVFKKNKNLVILSAILKLKKGNKKEIKNRIGKCLNYRKKSQPLNFSSAGSIFQNPEGRFAGELIERCGLKGKRIGQARISKTHANFIVNLGRAKAKDVGRLIRLAKKRVKGKFGITLKEEIEII
jgi:UDP-N-acetylmuramate dehydrogenase